MRPTLRIALVGIWTVTGLGPVKPVRAQDLPNLPALTPAELQMKDNAKQPGAPAMILYFAVDTDNTKSKETYSMRIKIFNDEGKKYANVEIPYVETYSQVEEIQARTIGTDGKVTAFVDQVFDREIVKSKKLRYHAKVLTLPNVQAGCVIEYAYRVHYKEKVPNEFQHQEQYIFDHGITYPAAEWVVQRNLYLKHGHFTLLPVKGSRVEGFQWGLPTNALLQRQGDGRLLFDVDDIPAFEEEEYSPPEQNLKTRMNLYYTAGFYRTESYWSGLAATKSKNYDSFIGLNRSKMIDGEVARLTMPKDSDETLLRKMYDRVQQIRALDYEEPKTDKERQQEHLKDNKNAQDVLEHGYGHGDEINLLFIAMARAAGLEAHALLLSSRRHAFFMKGYPDREQLDAMVVLVPLEGRNLFLDPQSRYCPFDFLPWSLTSAGGIVVDMYNPRLGSTPAPKSEDAVSRREGTLKLSEEGMLQGIVKVSYGGQEALSERQWAIGKDDTKRREHLEESMKSLLTTGATVKLLTVDGWEKTGEPLKTEYEIKVPHYATAAGRRLVLPLGVLHTTEKNPFPSPRRTHPVYFEYPYEIYDDIRIELPAGMQAEGLPENKKVDQNAVTYEFTAKNEGNLLRLSRARRVGAYLISVEQYANLRMHYNQVLAGDSQLVTLRKTEVAEVK
jgi:hypothetical protein